MNPTVGWSERAAFTPDVEAALELIADHFDSGARLHSKLFPELPVP